MYQSSSGGHLISMTTSTAALRWKIIPFALCGILALGACSSSGDGTPVAPTTSVGAASTPAGTPASTPAGDGDTATAVDSSTPAPPDETGTIQTSSASVAGGDVEPLSASDCASLYSEVEDEFGFNPATNDDPTELFQHPDKLLAAFAFLKTKAPDRVDVAIDKLGGAFATILPALQKAGGDYTKLTPEDLAKFEALGTDPDITAASDTLDAWTANCPDGS
jgi:hypothetical protein